MSKEIEVDFGGITNDNCQQLKLINTTCFPITYAPGFYKDVVQAKNSDLNKFAYHNGYIIGAICCRVQDFKVSSGDNGDADAAVSSASGNLDEEEATKKVLYIMTLAVLPAYRGRGVGKKLLQSVLDHVNDADLKEKEGIQEVMLHVQVSNEDGVKFYTDKMGFEKGEKVNDYYTRIDPPHAFILRKKL